MRKLACASCGHASTQRKQHILEGHPYCGSTTVYPAHATVNEGAEESHPLYAGVCRGSRHLPDDLFPLKIDGIKVVHGRRKVCAHRVVYNSPKQVVIPNVGGGQLFEPNGAACYEYGRPKCPHSSLYCLITRNIITWGGDSASAAAESRCLFPNAKCSCLHANNNHPK